MTKRKILALIPARGGSKGLPGKNIMNLIDKPLIAWTIEASLNSRFDLKTFVSSDDDVTLTIAEQFGANQLRRPATLSADKATSESVIMHALEEFKAINCEFETVILLQPTSPLRDHRDIDNALNNYFEQDATALISVNKTDSKLLKAFTADDNGYLKGVSNNKYPFMRRQDLPSTYMSNGAIYIIDVKEFLKNESFFSNKTIHYEMDSLKSMDIDSLQDFSDVTQHLLSEYSS